MISDDDANIAMGYGDFVNTIRRLWRTDRGRVVHHVAGGLLGVALVIEIAVIAGDELPWLVPLAIVAALALAAQARAPFAAPLTTAASLAAIATIAPDEFYDANTPFVAVLLSTWCLGAFNDVHHALAGLIAAEAAVVWVNNRFHGSAGDYLWISSFVGATWLAALVVNRRGTHARAMAERATRLEREQVEAARLAVEAERTRISRELHDVIAHSVSVMTVQAGAVRRLLKPEQERERQALESVEETGRQALTEMRRLVGLLRDQEQVADLAPQPGLGTLDILVGTVREAGLPVELTVVGEPRELPAGVDLSAYRVVQEALTNALKYAGPAHAWVSVRWGERELELEVANDGENDSNGGPGGHGLVGMRERVALYGGDLESGERPGGGYVVRARLPIEERA